MKSFKYILIVKLLTLFVSCSNESDTITNPDDIEVLNYQEFINVSYGASDNQTYDIYLPEGRDENTKVMILVHGGGWNSGDKSSMLSLVNLYNIEFPDIAIININYRLADENNSAYPMQINDITSIVEDLKFKANEYVISNNFGFLGVSAGGHLSLLWSYGFDYGNDVKMVASIVGPTNFTDPAYLNNSNPMLQELLDLYVVDTSLLFLEEVSPIHQATSISPPTIHFYGGQDPLIPISQGQDLNTKLNSLNVINQYTLYPDAEHVFGEIDFFDTWNKLKLFTRAHLL